MKLISTFEEKFGDTYEIQLLNQVISNIKISDTDPAPFGFHMISELQPRHFKLETSKIIVNYIKKFYERYGEIPRYEQIKLSIQSNATLGIRKQKNLLTFIDHVQKSVQGVDYQVRDSCKDFLDSLYIDKMLDVLAKAKKEGDVTKLHEINRFVKELDARRNNDGVRPVSVGNMVDEAFNPKRYVPISLGLGDKLDQYSGDFVCRGNVGLIIMPTGKGKTWVGCRVATTHVLGGMNVIYICWEDNIEQISTRCYGIALGCKANDVIRMPEKKKYLKETFQNLHILKFDKKASIHQIRKEIDRLVVGGFSPHTIILDYIKKIKPAITYESQWTQHGGEEEMNDFMNMCSKTELNCFGLIFQQVTRGHHDDEFIDPENIKGDIGTLESTPWCFTINHTKEQGEEPIANGFLAKNRFGAAPRHMKNIDFDVSSGFIDTGDASNLNFKAKSFKDYLEMGIVW